MFILMTYVKCSGNLHLNASKLVGETWLSATHCSIPKTPICTSVSQHAMRRNGEKLPAVQMGSWLSFPRWWHTWAIVTGALHFFSNNLPAYMALWRVAAHMMICLTLSKLAFLKATSILGSNFKTIFLVCYMHFITGSASKRLTETPG